jgi:HSP20 family molecular chaperone IbpA
MADRSRDVERMIFLRREAEKIVRELFQPEGGPQGHGAVRVVADLRTDGDRYVLEVELPGVATADVQLYALGDALVLEGEKRRDLPATARPAFERAERDYGHFRRVFDLPGPADLSKTMAALDDGVLTIAVPRIVDRRGRPRPIKVIMQKGKPSSQSGAAG